MKKGFIVKRNLMHYDDLVSWSKHYDFKNLINPDDIEIVLAYSKTPVELDNLVIDKSYVISNGSENNRSLIKLEDGSILLAFHEPVFNSRWNYFIEQGASWEFGDFFPYIILSHNEPEMILKNVEVFPYPLSFTYEKLIELDD